MRNFDNWIKAYLEYTRTSEAPTNTHVWTAVSTIAGALRRKCWFDMGLFDWSPNFYIILVGPPGTITKSTTINLGMELLKELGVHFGPSVITWQALVSELAKSSEGVDILDNGIIETFSPITIGASEFGTLVDPKNRELVDVLVDLWDGRRTVWEKKTKTSGNDSIENPWINIIAATTPSWLADNMPESMVGGGFTSRCVFVYGDKKRQLSPYPFLNMQVDRTELRTRLLADLERIGMLKGAFTLEPKALEWGIEWYSKIHGDKWREMYPHLADERFAGYRDRKQAHMHKLAMVLSAAQRDNRIITVQDLVEADAILTATENESLAAVFNNIGKASTSRVIDRIIGMVKTAGRVPRSDVLRELLRVSEPRIVNDCVVAIIATGAVKQVQYGNTIYLEWAYAAPKT